MRQILPILFFMCLCCVSRGQNVLVKDSTSSTLDGSTIQGDIGIYTYNTNCQKIKRTLPQYQYLYSYYADGKLYQETDLLDVFRTGTYINQQRTTYNYNDNGRQYFINIETWNSTTNMFEAAYRDSLFYNTIGLLFRVISERYHPDSQTWTTAQEDITYYNDMTKQYDSTIQTTFPLMRTIYEDSTVVRSYYTYYTGSDNYIKLSNYYYYSNGRYFGAERDRHFIDSVNYIKKDSSVVETPEDQPDTSYVIGNRNVHTLYYNTDETLKHEDYLVYYAQGGSFLSQQFFIYGSCSSALPVTFSRFSAIRQNNNALVTWQTADEINASSFSIQRSTDGIHFITIEKLNASGNNSAGKAYNYTDANALLISEPKLYYRLAEQDKDGSIQYSSIAAIDIVAAKIIITASPNPAKNVVLVYSSTALNNSIIKVSDMWGKTVYSANQNISANSTIPVDVSAFAKGVYIITVQSSFYKQQIKIMKE